MNQSCVQKVKGANRSFCSSRSLSKELREQIALVALYMSENSEFPTLPLRRAQGREPRLQWRTRFHWDTYDLPLVFYTVATVL